MSPGLNSMENEAIHVADDSTDGLATDEIQAIRIQLANIRHAMLKLESELATVIESLPEAHRASGKNLLHYVSLRRVDIRDLQDQLIRHGLSSLGRCEGNVLATINAVTDVLGRFTGQPATAPQAEVDFDTSRRLLRESTNDLFGEEPEGRCAHIMVTMPSEAALDFDLIANLLDSGMNCMRVNCAHDDSNAWRLMISNLRRASQAQGKPCKVLMDLGGPKLRTGSIQPGPAVLKWRPTCDSLGRVIVPARIYLRNQNSIDLPSAPADVVVPVVGEWLSEVADGDELTLVDTRGRERSLKVVERDSYGVYALTDRTAYVIPGIQLTHWSHGIRKDRIAGQIGFFQTPSQAIVLRKGDRLILGDDKMVGCPAEYDSENRLVHAAQIGCSLPSVFKDLRPTERVLLDDGKISCVVEEVFEDRVLLRVTNAGNSGSKLRADKGINLPDSNLQLDALTSKDIEDLQFVADHADMVGYSFVRRAEDVARLQAELERMGRPDMPIVLKIENRQSFERLPSLLLAVMRSPVSGVMIARGDLAVEIGWQRLAEVQEEILWMCEAAHMPVVWATQVLETLAKTGMPSRAEITDAAMSVRAECVMLNKGPHILDAVRVLADILKRMQDHQVKKRPMLRRLRLADDLVSRNIAHS
jgi:pyruvate kinase